MELYFNRDAAADFAAAGVALPPRALQAMREVRVPQDMPFFLDERYAYLPTINAFLRDLPIMRCPSEHTWRAYAFDLLVLADFLAGRDEPHGLLEATVDDLRAFKADRRDPDDPCSAPTWNRSVAAFDKFYRWAEMRDLRGPPPFAYRGKRDHFGNFVDVNAMYDAEGSDWRVKCVSLEDYRTFRDVGLLGRLPDGRTPDPGFEHNRNAVRNALVADVLLNTGMRVTEFTSLLQAEVPDIDDVRAGTGATAIQVAPYTAKRKRGRTVFLANRLIRDVSDYVDVDRANAVVTGLESGAYAEGRGWRAMRPHDRRRASVIEANGGRLRDYREMKPSFRRQLLVVDEGGEPLEPAALWLGEDGRPLSADNVRTVFHRACRRCEAITGRAFEISPHTLRHTFAVHMLALLLRERLRIDELSTLRRKSVEMRRDAFRDYAINPLRVLQGLLGHRSVETTYAYLTLMVDVRAFQAAASEALASELADQREILQASAASRSPVEDDEA